MKQWLLVLSCLFACFFVVLMPLSAFATNSDTTSDSANWFDYPVEEPKRADVSYDTLVYFLRENGYTSSSNPFPYRIHYTRVSDGKLFYRTNVFVHNGFIAYKSSSGVITDMSSSSYKDFYLLGDDFPSDYINSFIWSGGSGSLSWSITFVGDTVSGGFVTNGVLSSLSNLGDVFTSILNSPIVIFVGLSVGCYLVTLSISKVKDLIKGY